MRKQEFNSKPISLLPLDEVPVHVHRFAARAPCDSQGSKCQCGTHTAEAASDLRSRKTERAAKEKPTPISQFFLAPAAPGTPTRRHALGRLPTPPPLPENLLSDCTENCPLCPLRAPRRFRKAPQLAAPRWGGSPPRPLCQKICYSDCTENCPLRPLRAPRRFGIRKSASNSGHSPLRGSGGCSMHRSMHYSMHCSMQCSTHGRPSLFAAHRR